MHAWGPHRLPLARTCSILAAAGALYIGGAEGLSAQTPNRPEITSLRFEGNESFSETVLASSIVTRSTDCRNWVLQPFCWLGIDFALDRAFLSPATFRADHSRLRLFYRGAGFREAQVDTIVDRRPDNTADVLYRIEEGEPHRVVSVEILGLEGFDDASVYEDLPISVGSRLDSRLLDATRDTLMGRLRSRGYAHADVYRSLFIPTGERGAEVEFDVYTGPLARFGPIEVVGNERVADAVILRMFPFREGSVYSRELLFEAQRNVYNLDIFRHAAIEEDLDHVPDSIVPLRITVNEGDSHRVRAGGGWDTAECFHAEARWSSLNYFGGARRLVLRGRAANLLTHSLDDSVCSGAGTGIYGNLNWVISTDFTQPFIFSPRNAFTASVYAERQSLQDVFVRRALGLSLGLSRSLGRATSLTLSYRPQIQRLNAAEIFFCTSFLICDPSDIDLLQAANLLAPVGLTFSRDRTNRVLSPTGGYTVFADYEHASTATGSDFQHDRVLAELTGFLGLSENLVIAARLRGGWLGAKEFQGLESEAFGTNPRVAHPQKRFYAGGANSVRGYAQNQLGPRVVSTQVENLVFPVDDAVEAVCTPEEVVTLTCDASGLAGTGRFFRRPAGGNRLLEGSLELRYPLWGERIGGAAFVDFGRVRDGTARFNLSDMAFTPGLGLRYGTPIGPLRLDIAYRPQESADLRVVSSQIRPYDPDRDAPESRLQSGDLVLDWVRVEDLALLTPRVTVQDGGGSFLSRLQIHFSIGQAF